MLRSVRVRVIEEGVEHERPGFFGVRFEEEERAQMSYVRYSTANADQRLREQIVGRALRDLEAFRDRYQEHADILGEEHPHLVEVLTLADDILG